MPEHASREEMRSDLLLNLAKPYPLTQFPSVDQSGQSSLYRAAAAGHYQVVQFLSSLYTDVNHSTDVRFLSKIIHRCNSSSRPPSQFGYGTALHAAAQNANWEAARVLVASGVDPTLVNRVSPSKVNSGCSFTNLLEEAQNTYCAPTHPTVEANRHRPRKHMFLDPA